MTSRAPHWYAAGLAALVSGCAAQPQHMIAPQPQAQYVEAALLEPCQIAEPKRYTISETIRVANARKDALVQCNRDKASIREALK